MPSIERITTSWETRPPPERFGKLIGTSIAATGHMYRTHVRNDLLGDRADMDRDVRSRGVRSRRDRDHLLESRISTRSPRLQVGARDGAYGLASSARRLRSFDRNS